MTRTGNRRKRPQATIDSDEEAAPLSQVSMSQVAMVPKTVTRTQPYSDGDTDLNSDSEQENTPPAKRPRALAETVTCKYTSLQQSLSTHQCDTPLTATGTGNRPAKTKALSSASKGHPSHIDRQWLTDGFKFGCTWGRGLAGPPASGLSPLSLLVQQAEVVVRFLTLRSLTCSFILPRFHLRPAEQTTS